MRWMNATLTVMAVALLGCGALLSARAGDGLTGTSALVDGVPLTVVRSDSGDDGGLGDRPGAVVVHGYAGSARLMRPFAQTLARNGYVVVLVDLAGHGASNRRIADPQPDVDVAVRHLRAQPGVDPTRTVLIGHSRGAIAVTTYAADHHDIAATVAISLARAPASLPRNLLVLYGQLELPPFAAAARATLALAQPQGATTGRTYGSVADGSAVRADPIPAVEHAGVLFSPTTHERTLAWLDATVRPGTARDADPRPLDHLWPAALLLLGALLGFVPLARWTLRPVSRATPLPTMHELRWIAVALALGCAAAVVVGAVTPDPVLGLDVGGYTAVVLTAFALPLLLLPFTLPLLFPPGAVPPPVRVRPTWTVWPRALLLVAYTGIGIALPIHSGLTWAWPSAARAVPMIAIAMAAWLLYWAAQRCSGGRWYLVPVVVAAPLVPLGVLTAAGPGPGFLLFVMPMVIGLLALGCGVTAVLSTRALPAWLAAAVPAPLLAVPLAAALPLG